MFHKQSGFLPTITLYVGLLLAGFFSVILLLVLVNFIALAVQSFATNPLPASAYLRAFIFILFYAILVFIGYVIFSLFPSIRVTQSGIEYKALFLVRRVAWAEMVNLVDARWPRGTQALVFFPKPSNIWRDLFQTAFRLYPNQTYGILIGVHEPVVALSTGLHQREKVLREIQHHLDQGGRQGELLTRVKRK